VLWGAGEISKQEVAPQFLEPKGSKAVSRRRRGKKDQDCWKVTFISVDSKLNNQRALQ